MPESHSTGGNDRELWLGRQSALADFGRHALSNHDLDSILQEACVLAARGLDVQIAKVLEARPGGDLLLRAAVGVPPHVAVVGATTIPGHQGSAEIGRAHV